VSFIITGAGTIRFAQDQIAKIEMCRQPDTAEPRKPADFPLTAKIAFLQPAEVNPDPTLNSETRETHKCA